MVSKSLDSINLRHKVLEILHNDPTPGIKAYELRQNLVDTNMFYFILILLIKDAQEIHVEKYVKIEEASIIGIKF